MKKNASLALSLAAMALTSMPNMGLGRGESADPLEETPKRGETDIDRARMAKAEAKRARRAAKRRGA